MEGKEGGRGEGGEGGMEGEGEGLIEREGVLGLIAVSSMLFIMSFSWCIPVVMSLLSACLCMPSFPVLIVMWSSCIVIAHHFSMWLLWCLVSASREGQAWDRGCSPWCCVIIDSNMAPGFRYQTLVVFMVLAAASVLVGICSPSFWGVHHHLGSHGLWLALGVSLCCVRTLPCPTYSRWTPPESR